MKIFIDKEEKEYAFSDEELESVEAILKKMEELIAKEGKVFTKISVDGEVLNDENRERILSLSPDNVKEISFDTANPRLLAGEALDELIKYLPKLREGASTVSELLSVGEYEKGYNLFAKVIDGINWFVKLLKTLPPVIGINYKNVYYEDMSVADAFSEFEKVMNELLGAFEERNDLRIAEVLKEKLSPVLQKWVEIAKVLKDYAEKPIN